MRLNRSHAPAIIVLFLGVAFLLVPTPGQQATAIPVSIIVAPSKEQAQKLLDRLKQGDDFASLAKTQSVDPSAGDGGYLGAVNPANLRAELRNAVEQTSPGQISEIVPMPSGYAIIKVLASVPGAVI